MAASKVEPLSAARPLDRSRLHVFVAGPGEGEGIAIALPESGWVLVDGCRAVKQGMLDTFPLEHVVREHRANAGDRVELMVLTHPHRDHAHGFAELVTRFDPPRIALTGTATPLRTLAEEAAALEAARARQPTGQALRTGTVLRALRAINTWADEEGHELLAACDGQTLLDRSNVAVLARAPDQEQLSTWFRAGRMAKMMVESGNWLSAVLEVCFGETRIVLGGDLPATDEGVAVPCGWNLVMGRHPHLAYHHGLKVPHHGSREALHEDLVGPMGHGARAWCLTPFNSSSLPRTDDEDGLDILLRGQSPVLLTALSLSKKLQSARDDGRVTPQSLDGATRELRAGNTFTSEDTLWRSGTALDPLDAVWCVAFNANGETRGRWRGRAALEVFAPSKKEAARPRKGTSRAGSRARRKGA